MSKMYTSARAARSLLLGSAAAVVVAVAVSPAAAEDMKPIQYMKICSLYGDGFYYIPGSDTCIRFGGLVQGDYGINGSATPHTPYYFGPGGARDRTVNDYTTRARAEIDLDARSQTAYGGLRTFSRIRIDNNGDTNSVILPRAFIQFAGFTFGRVRSFSDTVSFSDGRYGTLFNVPNMSDTAINGNNEISYTWELGNGMALHVGAGERRARSVANLSTFSWLVGENPTTSRKGQQFPDPYVAFKVDRAWGYWATSITATPVAATYYTGAPGALGYIPGTACTAQPGTTFCDHPADTFGYAVRTGGDIQLPFIGLGDHAQLAFNYGVGAAAYAAGTFQDSAGLYGSGNTIALGPVTDAVYVNGAGIQLTTAWTAAASVEHYWTPKFATSVYGGYTQFLYNGTVVNNRWFCGGGGATPQSVGVPATSACDPSFNFWTVGSHSDWYPTPGFRLAVDVMYTEIQTAFEDTPVILSAKQGARPTGLYTAKNEGIASVMFRAQRQWTAD